MGLYARHRLVTEVRACRALRDRTGRRRNARQASEAGLANAARAEALLLPGKGLTLCCYLKTLATPRDGFTH
jgi:hypothetical protein